LFNDLAFLLPFAIHLYNSTSAFVSLTKLVLVVNDIIFDVGWLLFLY